MTRLAILWHMHQPYYEDLATGEHILPWVRLHAIKDYWGMAALLQEFPDIRVTFNLVPSLLVQIQAFAEDRARDRHLAAGLTPAVDLDEGERRFLIDNAFHAPVEQMIKPYPRYAQLHDRRNAPDSFTTDDLRDLQVLHKLAWMDPDWLARDPRLRKLVEKGRDYDETDKLALREVELEILRAVIPIYRELAESGRAELSTSPFYHPILPLLCDTDVHLRAHPHSPLPRRLFARPADAADQLERSIALHRTLFGSKPAGVWPSEGSVSDEVVELLATVGCQWTATDEEILARSLQRPAAPDLLYGPYEVGRAPHAIRCLFRDHALSDLIGFAYQSWEAEAAASDFIGRVRDAARRFAAGGSGEAATVTVILDGENAWEHYAGGGRPFLRALYRVLATATDIETVTMTEAGSGPARRLESIAPGSWINGDFYVWAGHPDDHRAWGQVAAARHAYDEQAPSVTPEARAQAWEELLIAEGSDWFWWYGDDHSSEHDRAFDDLFRRHLRNVYGSLGLPAPDDLHVSNISTHPAVGPVRPHGLTTPIADGRAAAFHEWAGAVHLPLGRGGGTMHRVAGWLVREVYAATDLSALYLRLDGAELAARVAAGALTPAIFVDRPEPGRVALLRDATAGPGWRVADVVEVVLPFASLGVQAGDRFRLSILLTDGDGQIVEQHPADGPLELEVPTRHVAAVHWRV